MTKERKTNVRKLEIRKESKKRKKEKHLKKIQNSSVLKKKKYF